LEGGKVCNRVDNSGKLPYLSRKAKTIPQLEISLNNRLKSAVLAFNPDLPEVVVERLRKIQMLIVDVDGVLTDGTIDFSDSLIESKGFSTRDGLILGRIAQFGLLTAAVSGRKSAATQARLTSLKFTEIRLGHLAKWPIVEQILSEHHLKPEDVAFMGDDLVDLPALTRVGLSVCPADSHLSLLGGVDVVLNTPGGRGCVREFLDLWLWANGKWEEFVNSFEVEPS
jgi:3-deoxy-D-manno-octulosonate 8-phosphate phosphatase (KDO 8-P phosphatase)